MKNVLLFSLCFLAVACYKNQDSSTDESGGLLINPGDSAEFIAAKTIFASRCNGCHAFESMAEDTFVATNRLTPGDPQNSTIYNSLKNSTAPSGDKDMPSGQPALDAAELQAISDWVSSVAP